MGNYTIRVFKHQNSHMQDVMQPALAECFFDPEIGQLLIEKVSNGL